MGLADTGTITASVDYDYGPSASVVATLNFAYLGSYQLFSCANPPDATHLVYCYQFTDGSMTWTEQPWSDGTCNFTPQGPVTSPMPYADPLGVGRAFGQIQVIRRYPNFQPDITSSYEIEQGWPEDTKMAITATPVDPNNDKCTLEPGYTQTGVSAPNLEIVPSTGLTPDVQHADGWNVSGSADKILAHCCWSTDRMLPAGSLNHAIRGPASAIPRSSCPVPSYRSNWTPRRASSSTAASMSSTGKFKIVNVAGACALPLG